MLCKSRMISFVLTLAAALFVWPALAQTTSIKTEYLGTLYAPLDPPQVIDSSLLIYNVQSGGWFKGPKLSATII